MKDDFACKSAHLCTLRLSAEGWRGTLRGLVQDLCTAVRLNFMHWSLILASTDRQSSLDVEDVLIPPLEVGCHYQNHDAAYIIDTIVYGVRYSGHTRTALVFPSPKCIFSNIFIWAQHFSCLPLAWPFPACNMKATDSSPLYTERGDHLKNSLIVPISCNLDVKYQLQFLCGMLCFGWFPDPAMDLLTLCPIFWAFQNSWYSPSVFFCMQCSYI